MKKLKIHEIALRKGQENGKERERERDRQRERSSAKLEDKAKQQCNLT